jgi:hypothetical protein
LSLVPSYKKLAKVLSSSFISIPEEPCVEPFILTIESSIFTTFELISVCVPSTIRLPLILTTPALSFIGEGSIINSCGPFIIQDTFKFLKCPLPSELNISLLSGS